LRGGGPPLETIGWTAAAEEVAEDDDGKEEKDAGVGLFPCPEV